MILRFLSTGNSKLSIHLPYIVDEKKAAAKWDAKTSTLSVTLPIIREDIDDRMAAAQ
jgi:hypothetical protein